MQGALAIPTHTALLQAAAARLRDAGIDTARLDAEVLLALALGVDRAGLYARLQAVAADGVAARFEAYVERRLRREPVAYITGVQEFWSLPFAVTPTVLIPRPETELVVEIVCRLLRTPADSSASRSASASSGPSTGSGRTVGGVSAGSDSVGPQASSGRTVDGGSDESNSVRPEPVEGRLSPRVARPSICDVGTGSGCVAVALARELPEARLTAIDISPDALAVAGRNAAAHRVVDRVALIESDLFDGLDPDRSFDVIVSNPPYLSPADRTSPELAFEPDTALAAGSDGLAIIRRLIAAASGRLRAGGWLVMEFGCGQDAAVCELAGAAGFAEIGIDADLAGIGRVLRARRAMEDKRG